MGFGVVTDIIVKGKRVIPAKALANNYRFELDTLRGAMRDLLDPVNRDERRRSTPQP